MRSMYVEVLWELSYAIMQSLLSVVEATVEGVTVIERGVKRVYVHQA